jgi:P-type E1-E2 ATPase
MVIVYLLTRQEVLQYFRVRSDIGLSTQEAKRRLAQYGFNTIPFRERGATFVKRDGKRKKIPSAQLVVGDLIELKAGDTVPADARIVQAHGLRLNEHILTGEHGAVSKHARQITTKTPLANRKNMVFAGTSIVSGSGIAVIAAIGTETELGKIALVLARHGGFAHTLRQLFQKKYVQISLVVAILLMLLFITLTWLHQGPLTMADYGTIFLIVSTIPVTTLFLIMYASLVVKRRILQKGGLVHKLTSSETFG